MSAKLLCQAIAERKRVSFIHRDERYTVEPYSVGYEPRDGRDGQPLRLRAWSRDGWTDFQVKFMSRIEIGAPFSADRLGHRAMEIVLCDVYGKSWQT